MSTPTGGTTEPPSTRSPTTGAQNYQPTPTVEPEPDDESDTTPAAPLAVTTLAAVSTAAVVVATRVGRGRRWVDTHVDTRGMLGPADFESGPGDDVPDHTIRLDPRDDTGIQYFEEDDHEGD